MKSLNSLIYWTSAYLLGLYVLFYNTGLFVLVFGLILLALIITAVKWSKYANYLLYIALFYLLGGLIIDHSLIKERQILEGEWTYVGRIKEIKEGKEWSRTFVELSGYWDGFAQKWKSDVKGEKVLLMVRNDQLKHVDTWHKIVFGASFNLIENKRNAGEFNARNYYLSQGIRYSSFLNSDTVIVADKSIHKGISYRLAMISEWGTEVLSTYVKGEEANVVRGMLLGDQSAIDWEVKSAFINTGSSHMLAVSGAHIAVITAVLIGLIMKLGFNARGVGASVFMLLFLWGYAILTGASPSVIRSVLMFSLFIVVRFSYRPANNIQILSLSALLILALNWNSALDVGFQLSYAAMLGIFLVYPRLLPLIEPKANWTKWLWEGTVLCIAAQVFTTPLALYHFHQFPNYFIFSNFLVLLASTPMLVGGMLLLAISPISFLAKIVGWLVKAITFLFIEALQFLDRLPGAVAYGFDVSIWLLIVSIVVAFWCVLGSFNKWKVLFSALVFISFGLQRWNNYSCSGIYVFNHDGVAFAIKKGNNAVFFCSDNASQIKLGERLMKDFQKIYPCDYQLSILPHAKEEVQIGDVGSIEWNESHYTVNYEGEVYHFVINPKKYSEFEREEEGISISFERVETVPGAQSSGKGGFWINKKGK